MNFSDKKNSKFKNVASWKTDIAIRICSFKEINIFYPNHTRLKNKIENNSIWEGAFYQSEWVKINSCWVISIFSF